METTHKNPNAYLFFECRMLLENMAEIFGKVDFLPTSLDKKIFYPGTPSNRRLLSLIKNYDWENLFSDAEWLNFLKISQFVFFMTHQTVNTKLIGKKLKALNSFFPKETSNCIFPLLID